MFTGRSVARWPGISCPFPGAGHSRWRVSRRWVVADERPPAAGEQVACRRHPSGRRTTTAAPGLAGCGRRGRRHRHGPGGRAAHRHLLGRAVPRDAAAQLLRPRVVQRRLVHRQRWGECRRQQHAGLRAGRDAAPARPVRPRGSRELAHGRDDAGGVRRPPRGRGADRSRRYGGRGGDHPDPARVVALGRAHGRGAPGAADVDRPRHVQRQGRAGRDRLHADDAGPGRDGLAVTRATTAARRRAGRRHHAHGGHPPRDDLRGRGGRGSDGLRRAPRPVSRGRAPRRGRGARRGYRGCRGAGGRRTPTSSSTPPCSSSRSGSRPASATTTAPAISTCRSTSPPSSRCSSRGCSPSGCGRRSPWSRGPGGSSRPVPPGWRSWWPRSPRSRWSRSRRTPISTTGCASCCSPRRRGRSW